MNSYLLIPLVEVVIVTGLVVLLLVGGVRHVARGSFVVFLVCMALWGLFIFMMRISPSLTEALLWEYLVFFAILTAALSFYRFTVQFTNIKQSRRVLYSVLLLYVLAMVLVPTGLVVSAIQMIWFGKAPVIGPFFFVYVLAAYAPIILSLTMLVRHHSRTSNFSEKSRCLSIAIGIAIMLFGGTTDFLPALGINIYPLGIIGNIIFSLMATVALLRYGFLEFRVSLHKEVAVVGTGIAVAAIAGVVVFVITQTFLVEIKLPFVLLIFVVLSLAFLPIARPAVPKLQILLGRLFYGTRYDYLETLERFNRETRSIDDPDGLASHLINMIVHGMRSSSAYLLLPDSQTGRFVAQSCYEQNGEADAVGISFSLDSLIIQAMKFEDSLIDVQGMDVNPSLRAISDQARQALVGKGVDLLVPLKVGERLTGMILIGGKTNSRPFSAYERRLLELVSRQASLAIENARLFSEERAQRKRVEEFNAERATFLDALAHELKTPLTSALSSSELLVNELRSHPENLRLLSADVWAAIKSLEQLVADILDFGRSQEAKLKCSIQRVNLRELVLAVKDEFSTLLRTRKQQDLIATLPDASVWTRADPARMKQVLRNLIDNAAKFSPPGSNICLRVTALDRSVQIEVEDSAEPIGSQDRVHLFTPYYRGVKAQERRVRGLGLGLFISKQLVELQGGKIWLAKNEQRGNLFCIQLPRG